MTLDETYERILLGIDKEKREHAIRLLQCLAFSRRPLHAKELAEVLAIEFDTAIPKLNTSLRPGDAHEAVLSACSTLVTIIELNDDYVYNRGDYDNYNPKVVQFSHYSVKEFLTSERLARSDKTDLSFYYISPGPAHTILAQSSISTLLQPNNHIGRIADNFPLAKYAAVNWFHHARCDGVASQIQEGMERLFDPDRKHFTKWISIHDIDNDGEPRSRDPSTQTKSCPLYYATLCGIGSLVEHLVIKRRQDPNKSHGRQGTPLHVAAAWGHITIARFLLEYTVDVNAWDRYTRSPLCAAEKSGNLEIAQLLLCHGADAKTLDNRGNSLLRKAIELQKLDFAALLLKGGANVNVLNSTLLHEAADSGSLDVAQLLLSHGADANTNILDRQGDSPLHKAIGSHRSHNLGVVELLLRSDADVNIRNIYNWTPLHEAARRGNCDIARLLLNHGADLNSPDAQGDSPLHKAVRLQKRDVVELLLKGGADINIRNVFDYAPLHVAASGENLDIVRLLLRHGADVNTFSRRANSPLHNAVRSQNLDVVEVLLKGGADVNIQSLYNPTPLHDAAGSGNLNITQLLLSHGAGVNTLDHQRNSPLHRAVRSQRLEIVEVLLKGGADVNTRGCRHRTPLHLASKSFRGSRAIDVSRLLIEHGADIDAQDDKGQTPFSIALSNGHRKLARFLSNDRFS